jgi:hypothetical protein
VGMPKLERASDEYDAEGCELEAALECTSIPRPQYMKNKFYQNFNRDLK